MTEGHGPRGPSIRPLDEQPPLPLERFVLADRPNADALEMDVLFVGAGPAGLSGAIELARLLRRDEEAGGGVRPIEIGVLDKAANVGEHNLSGAVVDPVGFHELFPELPLTELPLRQRVEGERTYFLTPSRWVRVPTPPTMRNRGNRIASICEIVRWLGGKAEELGVNVLPGFPVEALLTDGSTVCGVRTTPTGLGRDGGVARADAVPPVDIAARVTVLAEGSRGSLSQAWLEWQRVSSTNPQIYALGVKELWRVPRALGSVIHTLGWPLGMDTFGGSFIYPMSSDLLAIGLVVGLDYPDAGLDVHSALQRLKLHPLVLPLLEDGELLEWGAKTIPEGGYHSVPERRHGDGVMIVGDSAGYVDVSSLKGIHHAMRSGIAAARQIFGALKSGDTSAEGLSGYTAAIDRGPIMRELAASRNMRLAFKKGLLRGAMKAAALTVTRGRLPGAVVKVEEDSAVPKRLGELLTPLVPDGRLTFSKADAVFHSGNRTRDDIPSHLVIPEHVSPDAAELYERLCPAGVYRYEEGALKVSAPNCVDCKATDVLGPRWTPREGGSGPAYRLM